MLRRANEKDIDGVMTIWLDANLQAHPFIPSSYWENNYEHVKKMIPMAEVYVFECSGQIQGFIGLSGDDIAGIFVKDGLRSQRIGKQLLEHAKQTHPSLTLKVYQKNTRALAFYRREHFYLLARQTDGLTGEPEFLMRWER